MDARLQTLKRQCLSCPSGVMLGRDYCWQCKQRRHRQQTRDSKRRAAVVPRQDDYPPHVIEARYIRAVWQRNPRLAQALAQRAS